MSLNVDLIEERPAWDTHEDTTSLVWTTPLDMEKKHQTVEELGAQRPWKEKSSGMPARKTGAPTFPAHSQS